MKRIIVLVMGVLLFYLYSPVISFAFPVYNPENGHYYEAIGGNFDWYRAKTMAEESVFNGMYGHLATITSHEENMWLWFNLGTDVSYYLLGAIDENMNGDWKWITGEEWGPYINWSAGEPSNPSENVLEFWNNGQWNDIHSSEGAFHHGYIVEYEPVYGKVSEPATVILFSTGILMILVRERLTNPS